MLMRRERVAAAMLVATVLAATALAACTSGNAGSGHGKATTASSVNAATQQHASLAPTAATAGGPALRCADYIDDSAPIGSLQVVLGVVALPASPRYGALGTALLSSGQGPHRLFAKTGLVIKPGATFELVVPASLAGRLGIGWGSPAVPDPQVLVDKCANPAGTGWLAYAGGYWIDHPACVPIIVKAGGRQQTVHVGVGAACPGQQPPQGPTQS